MSEALWLRILGDVEEGNKNEEGRVTFVVLYTLAGHELTGKPKLNGTAQAGSVQSASTVTLEGINRETTVRIDDIVAVAVEEESPF